MSRAKKNRQKERKKMEDFLPEMEPDGEYYSCTWTQEHSVDCLPIDESHVAWEHGYKRLFKAQNGNERPCEEISKWDVAIHFEKEKWEALHPITTANIQIDVFDIAVKIRAIFDILTRMGSSEEEQDEAYQRRLYQELKIARESMTPAVQEMRRRQIAAPAMIQQKLLGPDGRPAR